jgi:hypothetical protein
MSGRLGVQFSWLVVGCVLLYKYEPTGLPWGIVETWTWGHAASEHGSDIEKSSLYPMYEWRESIECFGLESEFEHRYCHAETC